MSQRASITRAPIDAAALLAAVASRAQGATVLFIGTVRELNDGRAVERLDYTAYEPMACEELERIIAEATARWPGSAVVAVHRIGELDLGEVAVAIAASHPHRAAAFEAARHVIEEVKRRVPIWKREHYVGGAREWVACASASATPAPHGTGSPEPEHDAVAG